MVLIPNRLLNNVIQRAMEISSRYDTTGSVPGLALCVDSKPRFSSRRDAGPSSVEGRLEQILLQLNPNANAANEALLRQQQLYQHQQQREQESLSSSSLVAAILQQQQQERGLGGDGNGLSIGNNHAYLRTLLIQELEAEELRKALVAAAAVREQRQQLQQQQQNALNLELAYAFLSRNRNNGL